MQSIDKSFSRRLLLDYGWRFKVDYQHGIEALAFNDSSWRLLDLPHDWSIEGERRPDNPTSNTGGWFPAGTGWYRRTFTAPEEWRDKKIEVEFEGVYMNSDVWLNGKHLGFHPYGYTSFAYDLTSHIKFGDEKNVLAVRVNNQEHLNSRWYSGSGIYRHVWLDVTHHIRVAHWGVFVTTPEVSEKSATVRIRTKVENTTPERQIVTLRSTILSPDGQIVGEISTDHDTDTGRTHTFDQSIVLSDPQHWSPDFPSLYQLESTVSLEETVVDKTGNVFGIRSLSWSAEEGLLLNGKSIKLRGGCVHHDNGCLGASAFDRAEERRVELHKSAGFNAIRCAHNPPSPAFLDACDRLGMLVMDEAFDCWEKGKNPGDYGRYFKDWWKQDLESMILRDRNHPSIIIWSIGNEVVERGEESGVRIANDLASYVRSLDSTRPITSALCPVDNPWSDTDDLFAALDIAGYNYIIEGLHYKNPELLPNDMKRLPTRIIAETESFTKDSFQIWDAVLKCPQVIGDFVWTSYDYLGEAGIGNWGEPRLKGASDVVWHVAYCGDLDLCGFPRPQLFYRNVVQRQGEKLHIFVHQPIPADSMITSSFWSWPPVWESWNWPGEEGRPLDVWAYSACDRVQLFLNGKLIGEEPTTWNEECKARFTVPYEPGILKAVGFNGDKIVAEKIIETTGPASQIRLTPDRGELKSDGQDLSFIKVEMVDKKGRFVSDTNNLIKYRLEGPGEIAGICSGDPVSEESYKGDRRRVFHGRGLLVIKSNHAKGSLKLVAESEGLKSAEVSLQVKIENPRLTVLYKQ